MQREVVDDAPVDDLDGNLPVGDDALPSDRGVHLPAAGFGVAVGSAARGQRRDFVEVPRARVVVHVRALEVDARARCEPERCGVSEFAHRSLPGSDVTLTFTFEGHGSSFRR